MDSTLCIGIDVAQELARPGRSPYRTSPGDSRPPLTASDPSSSTAADTHPRLIAFEASGGYERPLADTLTQAQLPFAILNPRNVRYHARSTGILAKTDRIDAAVIAQFVYRTEVQPKPAPSPAEQAVRDLVTRRNQLVEARTREQPPSPAVLRRKPGQHRAPYRLPQTGGRHHRAEVAGGHRPGCLPCAMRSERLRSVPGVGETLAAALLGAMPELGRL